MRVYYAHCIAIYNTPQEARDVLHLEMLGFDVVNPNDSDLHRRCDVIKDHFANIHLPGTEVLRDKYKAFDDAGHAIMELVFKPLVSAAKVEGVVFRALPDGRIPAGVAQELEWAKERGLPILELPTFAYDRIISVELTRTYLHEIGER